MLRRAPTPKRQRRSGIRPPSRHNSEAHRAWIRTLRCVIGNHDCRGQEVQCCHHRLGNDGMLGGKPSDVYCWPGCFRHHDEQHRIGEPAFAAKYRLDLRGLALDLAKRSPCRRTRERAEIIRLSDQLRAQTEARAS